ncbi:hypothetical protein CLOSYM_01957 [[Clostridium] symbiosum ATCC 14940]|uniref:Uncharacterized protein n=1 Tax=[Clostridium] symbiosum ATCC 14940 TaxID=411472 RepID=A0ABC9TYY7_CLOSY|nr:hypothetical protein CLOSYM_01957 [[Clostridium] symbiosum ATCC 14940]
MQINYIILLDCGKVFPVLVKQAGTPHYRSHGCIPRTGHRLQLK